MGPDSLNHPLRTIFCGTPQFAAKILSSLHSAPEVALQAVLTQPDRKQGRGQKKIQPSPVKELAQEQGLQVLQPASLQEAQTLARLRDLAPDLILVAAYGLILPKQVLSLPQLGAINVHASLLPKYRGAAPIQRALQNGEQATGISIMQMTQGLDCGPILRQKALAIGIQDTTQSLEQELARMGASLLQEAIKGLLQQEIVPIEQDESRASYAPMVRKQEGHIPWERSAWEVHNHIRAMQPWPGAFFDCALPGREQRLRLTVYPGQIGPELLEKHQPGTILGLQENSLAIACRDRVYLLPWIKASGGKILSARDFCHGYLKTSGT
ncbi:MAG: methionyl-tRNA formyltransferase [Desulfohalobiaceae bacterium]